MDDREEDEVGEEDNDEIWAKAEPLAALKERGGMGESEEVLVLND